MLNVFHASHATMTMPPSNSENSKTEAAAALRAEIIGRPSNRAEIEWSVSDRFNLLRHSPAIAEGIYSSIALGWGYQIFTFNHSHDVIANAMTDLFDNLTAWGLLAVMIGVTGLFGALFRVYNMRVWSIRANMMFMLFAWVSMARSHVWTPGIIIIPVGYLLWMYITYCDLLSIRNDT